MLRITWSGAGSASVLGQCVAELPSPTASALEGFAVNAEPPLLQRLQRGRAAWPLMPSRGAPRGACRSRPPASGFVPTQTRVGAERQARARGQRLEPFVLEAGSRTERSLSRGTAREVRAGATSSERGAASVRTRGLASPLLSSRSCGRGLRGEDAALGCAGSSHSTLSLRGLQSPLGCAGSFAPVVARLSEPPSPALSATQSEARGGELFVDARALHAAPCSVRGPNDSTTTGGDMRSLGATALEPSRPAHVCEISDFMPLRGRARQGTRPHRPRLGRPARAQP